MGILEESLVERLLETTPAYKRDVMEQSIRQLLSATPLTEITGLPARRGAADGGIDGIMHVNHFNGEEWEPKKAAINVKVRKSSFTREQLGGFLLDMDRESIYIGIIITASNLSPDAQAEFIRKNSQGNVFLFHLCISDILSGRVYIDAIEVDGQSIKELLTNNIREICSN